MLFAHVRPEPLPEAARMGFRSRLVLEKLGFELRERYDGLMDDALPGEIGRLASRLDPDRVVRLPRCDPDELRRFASRVTGPQGPADHRQSGSNHSVMP
jgi:hypothetical protein